MAELTENDVVEIDAIKESGLTTTIGMDIQGLEDIPLSMAPIPWVRLVQPSSTKIELADGKTEAPVGSFYFNDTKTAVDQLEFIMLRAKTGSVEFERNGKMTKTSKLAILGITTDKDKLFVLSLSVTSFASFGVLTAMMKDLNIKKSWEYVITLTTDKQENEKGKYYVARFNLAKKVDDAKLEMLEQKYHQYGIVLDRSDPTTESSE